MESIPLKELLLNEFNYEATLTRRMLELVPFEKASWKPHPKSMALRELAGHLAIIPAWVSSILNTTEMDHLTTNETLFLTGSEAEQIKGHQSDKLLLQSTEQVLDFFDTNTAKAVSDIGATTPDQLMQTWTMRAGEHIFFSLPRLTAIRNLAQNHNVHHRGQLSVYLRLLGIPLPAVYGSTADTTI